MQQGNGLLCAIGVNLGHIEIINEDDELLAARETIPLPLRCPVRLNVGLSVSTSGSTAEVDVELTVLCRGNRTDIC